MEKINIGSFGSYISVRPSPLEGRLIGPNLLESKGVLEFCGYFGVLGLGD